MRRAGPFQRGTRSHRIGFLPACSGVPGIPNQQSMMNPFAPFRRHTAIRIATMLSLAGVTLLAPGCVAPGQSKAASLSSLAKRAEASAGPTRTGPAALSTLASPLIIEVSVGHSPAPATVMEREGLLGKYVEAAVRAQEAIDRRAMKPKRRAEFEQSVRAGWSNVLAGEHLDRLSEIYHGMEAVEALRAEIPGSRVYLSIADAEEETRRSRNFAALKSPQQPVARRPVQFPGDPVPPIHPWVGHYQQSKGAEAPAGLVFHHDISRAVDAQVALDVGATYGRMLGVVGMGQLAGEPRPFFVSADTSLSTKGADRPWAKAVAMENSLPSAKQMRRGLKHSKKVPYDVTWLSTWFGCAPSEIEWREYQAALQARGMDMLDASKAVRDATLFGVDERLLTTNSIPVTQSPFLPYYRAMAREMHRSLSGTGWAGAQEAQLKAWTAGYDSRVSVTRELLTPDLLPAGSRERTLATFLNAELRLRERVTDFLMKEQYVGELGDVVRGQKHEEEKIASNVKTMRGVAIAVAIVGAGVGAGAAVVGVSAASAGNMVAAQTAQSTINTINNTVNSTVTSLMVAEQGLVARSRDMSVNMAEKIGPLEVEVAGQVISITAGSVGELRGKLRDLYIQRFP